MADLSMADGRAGPDRVPARDPRSHLLRRGYQLAVVTVTWNVLEGLIAVGCGRAADSIALLGFGIDSFIETTSAMVVGWRIQRERRAAAIASHRGPERLASRLAGGLLLLLAIYLVIESGRRLGLAGPRPGESPVGIALTAVSLIVMPVLGRAKLRVAAALASASLRADAWETITCAWLSLTTLGGLALNAALGWWWADPAAALLLVPLITREGAEALRGSCCGRLADGPIAGGSPPGDHGRDPIDPTPCST